MPSGYHARAPAGSVRALRLAGRTYLPLARQVVAPAKSRAERQRRLRARDETFRNYCTTGARGSVPVTALVDVPLQTTLPASRYAVVIESPSAPSTFEVG